VGSVAKRLSLRAVCLALITLSAAAPALADLPPASAFAGLPNISNVELSPNGNLLAWADRSSPREVVVIFDLAARDTKRQVDIDPETKLRGLHWADDETLLVDFSSTGKNILGVPRFEFYRTLAVDVRYGSRRTLLLNSGQRAAVTESVLVAWRTTKPTTVVMWSRDFSAVAERRQLDTLIPNRRADSGWVSVLFEVNTATGWVVSIDKGNQYTSEWVVDQDGHSAARSDWYPQFNRYRVLAKYRGGWREVYQRTDGSQLKLQGLTADGQSIVAIGVNKTDRSVVLAIPRNGTTIKVLFQDPHYDIESVIRDRFSGAPIGVQLGGLEQVVHWFDAAAQDRFDAVAPAFKDQNVQIQGRSEDGKRVVARVGGPSHPAVYYLVDFNTNKADIIGEEYPALNNVTLGEVRAITYKARDGQNISAYLTVPPGVPASNLPLVVLPHGGPEGRDQNDFNWWSQFIASRGYAVLQPQFRGSTGFGDAYRMAGHQQWGGRMQDDVTDGVRALIDQGIADAKRVCIVGGSYGGYAALAGAAFTPDLYKCAVSVNGVADLPQMIGNVKAQNGVESDSVAYWQDNIGSPYDRKVIERSPARAADRMRVPVLLIHGVDDTVVPIGQSEAMARALGKLDKPFSFIRLEGEDHWLSRPETRLRVLTEIQGFLRENL
jgi:dipeptidyl aminopeptidase/acylaminoacyl peptidase